MLQIFRRTVAGLMIACAVMQIGGQHRVRASASGVVISQVYGGGGNSGATYKNDFIELFNAGAAAVDLTGWSVQYASSAGSSWQTTRLAGVLLPGQYYLVQEAAGTGGTVSLPTPDVVSGIAMSATAGKVALVGHATALSGSCPLGGAVVDFVGFGSASCSETAPTPALSNTTAALRNNGGATDTDNNAADFTIGAPNPRSSGLHVTASTTPATADLGDTVKLSVTVTPGVLPPSTGITVTADLSGIGGAMAAPMSPESGNIYSLYITLPTDAGGNPLRVTARDDQQRTTTMPFPLTVDLPIHTIQGAGLQSPFAGWLVQTQGIVTGVRPAGSRGFFIQTDQVDADPNTSEGVFVYTSLAPPSSAAVGNLVTVKGAVQEYVPSGDPYSPSMTEIGGSVAVTALSSGNALPEPVALTADDVNGAPGIRKLEKYAGMRVHVDRLVSVGPTGGTLTEASATSTTNGRFVAVLPGTPRPFREPGIEPPDPVPADAPSPSTVPLWDGNPERIALDTGAFGPAGALDVTSATTIADITGPLDYFYRMYAIDTETKPTVVEGGMSPRPVRAANSGEFAVATMNLARFYDTVKDPLTSDVALTPAAFALRLAKASMAVLTYMRAPDIIGVEEMENLATLQALADRIAADSNGAVTYRPYLMEGHDVSGIDVGLLARADTVAVGAVEQIGFDTIFTDGSFLNDRPSLVVHATVGKAPYDPSPVVVVVNHLRSLSGIDDPIDGSRVRSKRLSQAIEVAGTLQAMQAAGERVVSVGDYNAYEVNDGYVDVVGLVRGAEAPTTQVTLWAPSPVAPSFLDLATLAPAGERYSYVYDGNAQDLDHILFSANVRATGIGYARINADFPEALHGDGSRVEALSDHDPIVGYFDVDATPPVIASAVPDPAFLWPPNHRMVPVTFTVSATDDSGVPPACAVAGVTADDGATATDWEITGALTVDLRAERVGGPGRTYTIAVACVDGSSNVATKSTVVTVPHDQRR